MKSITQAEACEYFHKLIQFILSEECRKEAENLSVNTTNRGFYQSFTRPPRPQDAAEIAEIQNTIRAARHQRELKQLQSVKLNTLYDEMKHTYFRRRFMEELK